MNLVRIAVRLGEELQDQIIDGLENSPIPARRQVQVIVHIQVRDGAVRLHEIGTRVD